MCYNSICFIFLFSVACHCGAMSQNEQTPLSYESNVFLYNAVYNGSLDSPDSQASIALITVLSISKVTPQFSLDHHNTECSDLEDVSLQSSKSVSLGHAGSSSSCSIVALAPDQPVKNGFCSCCCIQ